ncbi:hypothetical protein FRC12_009094 [Ceratobasidium sp. 428]|nr:hypothetical protein FRC12_009094 [Ceratobasidium sp. 428]
MALYLRWQDFAIRLVVHILGVKLACKIASILRIPISRTNLRLSNGYIALRFLPQVEYETIAPLSVSPDPDRVVRLVLLFKTLSIESFQAWDLYRPSYCQGAGIWKDIIGWEETNAKSSFEVFEVTCTEVY